MNSFVRIWNRNVVEATRAGVFLAALVFASHAQAGETITFLHSDIAGSPMLATDINGLQAWKETYRPYGDRLIQSGASQGNDLWYTGKSHDEDTGLSYFGARYYDPTLGRFTAMDPVGVSVENLHSFNRYAYANNNPHRFNDPDGRQSREFNWENQRLGVTSPPRSSSDWMGPALGVALTAVVAAPVAAELFMAALANPGAVVTATAIAAEAGGVTVGANHIAGKAAERLAATEIVAEGSTILGSQVAARTSEGLRVIDHLVESSAGKIFACEVKCGNGVRNAAQLAKDGKMATEGAVLTGKNAPEQLRGQRVILETAERRYPRQ